MQSAARIVIAVVLRMIRKIRIRLSAGPITSKTGLTDFRSARASGTAGTNQLGRPNIRYIRNIFRMHAPSSCAFENPLWTHSIAATLRVAGAPAMHSIAAGDA